MFFEARDHILNAFRKAGVREGQLSPKQRTPDQYQRPGVWAFTADSTLEKHNKASREFSDSVKKFLFRGHSKVRVEVVAQKEDELQTWVAGALEWLLEHPLERDGCKFDLFVLPLHFRWLDDEGVLPDTRSVMFEITVTDALIQGVESTKVTPSLDDLEIQLQT